jgi:hypothetical protein
MKPLKTWQHETTSALEILKKNRINADYFERYYRSKSWKSDEKQWRLVGIVLDGIIKELTEKESK